MLENIIKKWNKWSNFVLNINNIWKHDVSQIKVQTNMQDAILLSCDKCIK